jgi:predicted Rdx family selenoprotein
MSKELYLRKVVVDVIPVLGIPRRISDLRVKFKIVKTLERNPNRAEVQIYNLAPKTKSLLEAKNTKLRVSIGYLGLTPEGKTAALVESSSTVETVLIGDVTKAVHKGEFPDIITKIEVGDGTNKHRNSRHDKGYPPGTKFKQVVRDVVDSMGLGHGPEEGIPDKSFAHGISLSGLSREHLTELLEDEGLEWSIQDETVQILPQDKGTSESIIFLSPETGLIGSPNPTAKGVEFTSLLQPRLRPGRRVQLESREFKGIFKVRTVTQEGDSHKEDFFSKCEATK